MKLYVFFKTHYRSSIMNDIILKYFFLLFLPTLILWLISAYIFRQQSLEDMLRHHQDQLDSSYNTLQTLYTQVNDIFSYVQGNSAVTDYMDSLYTTDVSMVYNLKKSIRPFFSEIEKISPDFELIKAYCKNQNLLHISPEFNTLESLPLSNEEYTSLVSLNAKDILWVVNSDSEQMMPTIRCYKKIYTPSYYSSIGYIELTLSDSVLQNFLSLQPSSATMNKYLFSGTELIYADTPLTLPDDFMTNLLQADAVHPSAYTSSHEFYTNKLYLGSMGITFYSVGRIQDIASNLSNSLFSTASAITIILFLLSLLYFFFMTGLPRRILDFSRYIGNSHAGEFKLYEEDHGNDELNTLISTYNAMIRKNTELIDNVHKLEILNRDARFSALQAQIHPHFIYGTLESIRMMANANNDYDTAKMIFSFSKLMRYSLANGNAFVTLDKELEHLNHYLLIQKIRFSDRLTYMFDIQCVPEELTCPAFILQPLAENALIHGISHVFTPCSLTVAIYEDAQNIRIEVSNTGAVPSKTRLKEVNDVLNGLIDIQTFRTSESGFALYNVNERLKAFYQNSASMTMACDGAVTTVIITFERNTPHENTDS